MRSAAILLQIALSGLIAGTIAGIFAAMLAGLWIAGLVGLLFGLFLSLSVIVPVVEWMGLPAIIGGGVLWALGADQRWARRRSTWAGAGALIGQLAWVLPRPEILNAALRGPMQFDGPIFPILFALAGAVGALTFRSTMRILMLFAPESGEA